MLDDFIAYLSEAWKEVEQTTAKLEDCNELDEKRRLSNMSAAMKTRMFFSIRQFSNEGYFARVKNKVQKFHEVLADILS